MFDLDTIALFIIYFAGALALVLVAYAYVTAPAAKPVVKNTKPKHVDHTEALDLTAAVAEVVPAKPKRIRKKPVDGVVKPTTKKPAAKATTKTAVKKTTATKKPKA